MAKKEKQYEEIVVEVENGMVQNIYSSVDACVTIVDWDNLSMDEEEEKECKKILKDAERKGYTVY